MSTILAEKWWVFALRGVFAILFDLIPLRSIGSVVSPGKPLMFFSLLFAAYLLAGGILSVVATLRVSRDLRHWDYLRAEGVLSILIGMFALLFPISALATFALVTAVWSLMSGGLMIGATYKLRPSYERDWLALAGIVSILFGLVLVIVPRILAGSFIWWLMLYALASGVSLLLLAFCLRRRRDAPDGL